jgi:hypothetical protein
MEEQPKEDFLEVDPKIPGQNYVCLSFVSPEKALKQKEVFFVSKFLDYVFNDEIDLYSKDLREKLLNKQCKPTYDNVKVMYEDWKYTRTANLESEFHEINDYKTTMRGLKIRGVYDSHKEANVRAQILRRRDPSFNVFVGQVGYWLPWDPECESIPEQEYQEGMLNDLVKQYKENLTNKDELYEQVKNDRIEKDKKEINERKETLRTQTEMKVTPDDNIDDVKNIEKLREIIDESDKLFYDNMKKEQEQKKEQEKQDTLSQSVAEEKPVTKITFEDFGEYVTNNVIESSSSNFVSIESESPPPPPPLEEVSPSSISSSDINDNDNFVAESMENLESDDPWIQRKNKKD